MKREIEFKLELSARLYDEILAACPKVQREVCQENTFFDTEDRILASSRWALRIRRESDRYLLTVKGPSQNRTDEAYARIEIESPLSSDDAERLCRGFSLEQSEAAPCRHLRGLFGDLHLVPLFSFKNLRKSVAIHNMNIELDRTEILGKIFYELELETTPKRRSEDQAALREWFASHNWQYTPSRVSKLQRALAIHSEHQY